ncbi:aldo/keto reductase [Streptomyces chiangmaiensis]|uniref:Aldo/keto reductase n=1 Tax=Streptomyces chiangmaiensis TaxID=766497 RepID=A0ABU7FS01_9ACTN|nr:aldo/keto reductase [Streptomyces chiangmaiensis]MED7826705.1 aldo/keto reductase [Streptomyces chiangmaiensis]
MHTRSLGDLQVSAIGLGGMPLSLHTPVPDEQRAIATVHTALDAGVTLIDTADAYAPGYDVGHNERVIRKALATYGGDTSGVLVATKGGHTRTPDGGWGLDGSPEHLRRACEASLTALGVEAIGLYQHHRPDPSVPYAESLGALRDLRDAGKLRLVGISNVDESQIRLALDILGPGGLASVQNEFSPAVRSSRPQLDLCGRLGIAFLPWSPLGGMQTAHALEAGQPAFADVAADLQASPQQVCLAWHLAQGEHVIPIPGCSRPQTARDSASAADLTLTPAQLALLEG